MLIQKEQSTTKQSSLDKMFQVEIKESSTETKDRKGQKNKLHNHLLETLRQIETPKCYT